MTARGSIFRVAAALAALALLPQAGRASSECPRRDDILAYAERLLDAESTRRFGSDRADIAVFLRLAYAPVGAESLAWGQARAAERRGRSGRTQAGMVAAYRIAHDLQPPAAVPDEEPSVVQARLRRNGVPAALESLRLRQRTTDLHLAATASLTSILFARAGDAEKLAAADFIGGLGHDPAIATARLALLAGRTDLAAFDTVFHEAKLPAYRAAQLLAFAGNPAWETRIAETDRQRRDAYALYYALSALERRTELPGLLAMLFNTTGDAATLGKAVAELDTAIREGRLDPVRHLDGFLDAFAGSLHHHGGDRMIEALKSSGIGEVLFPGIAGTAEAVREAVLRHRLADYAAGKMAEPPAPPAHVDPAVWAEWRDAARAVRSGEVAAPGNARAFFAFLTALGRTGPALARLEALQPADRSSLLVAELDRLDRQCDAARLRGAPFYAFEAVPR